MYIIILYITVFYIIIKKHYIHTIIGSPGRDCVFIILFQLYGTKVGLFEDNLFWVD